MTIFRNFLITHIHETRGVHITPLPIKSKSEFCGNIVELDATDSKKFSRHLIITLQGKFVFRNNKQVGEYVNLMCTKIKEIAALNYSGDSSKLTADTLALRKLFFLKRCLGNIGNKLFFDLSVYESNQNFRLPLSSKFEDVGKKHFS